MSDSRELAAHDGGQQIVTAGGGIPVEQRMAMLREALINPDVDPAKAVAMAELMFRLEDRDRQAEFNRDKIAAKKAMPAIFKRGYDDHKKKPYVLFEDMQRAIDPVLERFNLMLDFEVGNVGNDIAVTPVLRHQNGWVERGGTLKGPSDAGPGRSPIQGVGSSVSYLKRYCTEAILNLVRDGEDNDGAIRPDTLLNDRQQGLVVNAQAAADRDEYPQWFAGLNPKDKALLINSGNHARLGGGKALPAPTTIDNTRSDPQPEPEPARDDPPAGGDLPAVVTPEGWTAQYELDCQGATDLEALQRVQLKAQKGIARLKDGGHTDLHQRAIDAGSNAHKRLTQPADGLFGDDNQ